jgi:cobalt-zinc-cadmium efflux system outer membrane protein
MMASTLIVVATLAAAPPLRAAEPIPEQDLLLTLSAARAEAVARSPRLRASAAELEAARAELVRARTYPHNPRVEVEAGDRRGPGDSSTDRGIALSQELEIGGQRRRRVAVARAGVASAAAGHERRRLEVRGAVDRAFAEAVSARERLAIDRLDVGLTRNLLTFEERRLAAGAGTRIDVNLARAAAGRAVRRFQRSTGAWEEARARLAEVVGLDPASPPRIAGEMPTPLPELPPVAELARRAVAGRQDLAAAREAREGAERRIGLERSLAVPDLDRGVYAAREEGDDRVGLRAAVALPLFDRNPGGVAQARAERDRVAAELDADELRVRREVATAHARYRAATEALEALDGLVVETLEESLDLLRRALDAGELSGTDVLLLRRELVEGRRERIAAADELWLARIELELATGVDLSGDPSAETGGVS